MFFLHSTNKDIEEEEGEMKAASALVLVFLLVSVAAMTIEKRLKKFFPPVCKKANGTNWYKVGCYCVQHFKGPVDFATAESNCARQAPGGHLVSLHSEQENAAVLSIIMKYSAKSPRTWMGGLQIPSNKGSGMIWNAGGSWDTCVPLNRKQPLREEAKSERERAGDLLSATLKSERNALLNCN
ncbi:hypothetical protein JZ751_012918 [Albula glossodonta]|uniref:C-type lectin domain-containing protein n=1 Tax=Albula glossodonta TaxID=121402 RepID=A0A8T2MZD5_9TELE|nr:hypothetical protein JZ751_012918 [Albula glossodonta]